MEHKVDARGLACPKPVIETKKALETLKEGSVLTIVDNSTARENVMKLAKKLKFHYDVKEQGDTFEIRIFKGELNQETDILAQSQPDLQDLVILCGNDVMGEGSRDLGDVLIRGYFYTLTEFSPKPKSILFVNAGAKLTIEESPVLEHLRVLEAQGVEILTCGTCLEFYGIKDKLAVGGVTNMYTIVEETSNAKNTVRI